MTLAELNAHWLAKRPDRHNYQAWRIWLLEWSYAQDRLRREQRRAA